MVVAVIVVLETPAAGAISPVARTEDRRNDFAEWKRLQKFLDVVEFDCTADER